MKELLFSFFFALVVGSAINGCMQSNTTAGTGTPGAPPAADSSAQAPGSSPVVETTDANFQNDVLASKEPVLVDFSASWCGPCKAMAPIIDRVANKYSSKLKVVRVDIDNNQELSNQFKIGPIPTFMVFKDGKRLASFSGFTPQEALESSIKPYID